MPHFFGGRCTASNFQTEWNWKVSKGKNTLSPYLSLSTLSLTKTTTYLSLSLSLSSTVRSSFYLHVRFGALERRSRGSPTSQRPTFGTVGMNCFGKKHGRYRHKHELLWREQLWQMQRQQLLPEEDREPLQPPLTNNLQGTFMHLSMVHTGAVSFSIWGKQKYFKSNGMR